MFENVNYTFYSETLGRSAIPDSETFDRYALENKLTVEALVSDGLISERKENGIDSAVCMMCEVDYLTQKQIDGTDEGTEAVASESIQGYSYSYNQTARNKAVELNAESAKKQKLKWLRLYCDVFNGWKV